MQIVFMDNIKVEQRIEKEEVRYVPLKIVYKQKDADRIYGQYKSGKKKLDMFH